MVITRMRLIRGLCLKSLSICAIQYCSGRLMCRRLIMMNEDCFSAATILFSIVLLLRPVGHLISHSNPSITISGLFCPGIELGRIKTMSFPKLAKYFAVSNSSGSGGLFSNDMSILPFIKSFCVAYLKNHNIELSIECRYGIVDIFWSR